MGGTILPEEIRKLEVQLVEAKIQAMFSEIENKLRLVQQKVRDLEDQNRSLTISNDPKWDGTDAAHPAWWRGAEHGFDKCKDRVAELDAKVAGLQETIKQQFEQLRERDNEIDGLETELADLRARFC